MREVLEDLSGWFEAGVPAAVATVVQTWRSAPRRPGASMAVAATGEVVGSVSGGCVEGAVYELARQVIVTGVPVTARYGVSDRDAVEVGLTCGGELEVLVQAVDPVSTPHLPALMAAVRAGDPVALATVVGGPGGVGGWLLVTPTGSAGSLGDASLNAAAASEASSLLARGLTATAGLEPRGMAGAAATQVFVQSFVPPPRMLVFGAIDFAAAVSSVGRFLGYRVTVCDARAVFATSRRLPAAHEVVVDWPHRYLAGTVVDERTVICVLTHDPKFDVPLLEVALRTPAAYVGAMGSRRTHEQRLSQLRAAGVAEADLARLSSPIGLDLGARTPEETAVSVAAEITALRWGGTGRRLSELSGPVHPVACDVGLSPARPSPLSAVSVLGRGVARGGVEPPTLRSSAAAGACEAR